MLRVNSAKVTLRQTHGTPRYPGVPAITDGCGAALWVESRISQAAFTFSADAGDGPDWPAGQPNAWSEPFGVTRLDSPESALSAAEGFTLAGGRGVSALSGSALLAGLPALHAIAGKRLPVVVHAASRAVTSHARTAGCSHEDIYGVLDAGWAVLFARNAQEVADFALVARRVAEFTETPFLVAQDGWLTSHSAESVRLPEPELMRRFTGRPAERLSAIFDPASPLLIGSVQGPESFFTGRLAHRLFADRVAGALAGAFDELAAQTGRRYSALRTWGAEDADCVVVAVGSLAATAEAAVAALRRDGTPAAVLSPAALRPFPAAALANALEGARAVVVLERADTPLASDNPLTREVKAALAAAGNSVRVHSAVCGIAGAPVRPAHIAAAIAEAARDGRRSFVLGAKHPDAVEPAGDLDARPRGAMTVRVIASGLSGQADPVRVLASTASELFGLHVRTSLPPAVEKRGLPRISEVTLAPEPVRVPGAGVVAEFVAVLDGMDPVAAVPFVADGGTLYVWSGVPAAELWGSMPAAAQQEVVRRRLRLACSPVAGTDGLLGAFLRLTPFREMAGLAVSDLFPDRPAARHAFAAIAPWRPEATPVMPLPAPVRDIPAAAAAAGGLVAAGFSEWVVRAHLRGRAADLPADVFAARSLVPAGTSGLRSFAAAGTQVPVVDPSRCEGCTECVDICPDGAISFTQNGRFHLRINARWCKGCGECVSVCGRRGALTMRPRSEAPDEPAAETPGAFAGGAESCAGCGEAAAVRMALNQSEAAGVIAAPGCPSEFSSVYPYNPFRVSWANGSLAGAAAEAMGVRLRWDQTGLTARRLWVVSGYAAMFENGLQSLSRLLGSGLDINVLVVDTETYATGMEHRKELGQIAIAHGGVFVAQTTGAHPEHFRAAVRGAAGYAGPSVLIAYAVCAREHRTAAGSTTRQAQCAVDSRAFPLFIYHPETGTLKLDGNPAEPLSFIEFARTEPRFASHFDGEGRPDDWLRFYEQDRKRNWERLCSLTGPRR